MAAKSMLDQIADPSKFDLRTHFWDSQGNLVKKNLYTLYVRDGQQYFERPINSGNLWTAGNQPCGRVEKTFGPTGVVSKMEFDVTAEHKAFTPQLTGDEGLHHQLEQERSQRIELEAELAAIKAERNVKTIVTGTGVVGAGGSGGSTGIMQQTGLAAMSGEPKLRNERS